MKLLKYTITRLLKIRGDVFIRRMRVGRRKELEIVKYGHHEAAIPASKLPNVFFFDSLLMYLQKSL